MEASVVSRYHTFPLRDIDFYPDPNVRTNVEMTEPHYHEMYEIYYLMSGERNYLIGNRTHRISPGDLVFIRPNEIHRATNTSVPYYERIVVHFGKTFLAQDSGWVEDQHSPFITHSSVLSLPVNVQKRVEELLHHIVKEYDERDIGFDTTIRSALVELLIIGIRQNRDTMDKPVEYATAAHRKISGIVRYINDNYESPLSLESLAGQFDISPYYLSRLFRKTTGFTYVEYLTTVRIKHAQRLLRETRWKVGNILEKVGFQDQRHFGKIFKKISNCTPLQYRKMYRK
ncbi:MAG: AraC family transcriptional regulator [Paenibacillaceae bacterium]|jgi:YesN/AraC family two-component response regulator|nr:AraC family transcriptional regulator [Paenibacillaceae bacterium]